MSAIERFLCQFSLILFPLATPFTGTLVSIWPSLSIVEDLNFDEDTASLLTTLFTVHLIVSCCTVFDDVYVASA